MAARRIPRGKTRRRNRLGKASLAEEVAIAARAGTVATMIEGQVVATTTADTSAMTIADGTATLGATTIDELRGVFSGRGDSEYTKSARLSDDIWSVFGAGVLGVRLIGY